MPDYSQYVAVKKVRVAQTANANTSIVKGRAPNTYDGYFPMYKGINLPVNALLSNKFIIPPAPEPPSIPFPLIELAGLYVWLDAADSSTITSVGGAASEWRDKTTFGNNLTQGTSIYQPAYSNNTMSFSLNKNFDIPNAAINNTTNYDLFMVFKPIASTNWIFAKQYDGNYSAPMLSMTRYVGAGAPETGTSPGVVYFRAGNNPAAGAYGTPGRNTVDSSSALQIGTLQILGIHNDSSNILINSGGTTLSTTMALSIFASSTITNFKLGAWVTGSNTFVDSDTTNFDLCEMIFFNTKISLSDRQKVEGYLAGKWGLQASLPSNHPYKTKAP